MWKTNYFQRKSMGRSRVASFEPLDHRTLLAGDVINAAAAAEVAENVAQEYFVNHPPRLQPGNAPLIGTSAFDGFDQVDVLWQTETGGEGTSDAFVTEYRRAEELGWIPAIDNDSFPTDVGTRVMHSASLKMLEWDTSYEYRVKHLRAGEVIETYQNTFQTRLPAGDPSPFSFAAYGDSAVRNRQDFNTVQARINQTDPDFSVLLGDNFYTFGTHVDADARFDPENSPAAIEWNSKKIDYFSVGNHDIFIEQGKASRDLFSNPVPLAGVTSPVQHPVDEIDEFNFSFDYGDVHFVTFDTNPVDITKEPEERTRRLDELIDYVVADLAASNAKWKIVYGHHPFIGTEKRQKADDFYAATGGAGAATN